MFCLTLFCSSFWNHHLQYIFWRKQFLLATTIIQKKTYKSAVLYIYIYLSVYFLCIQHYINIFILRWPQTDFSCRLFRDQTQSFSFLHSDQINVKLSQKSLASLLHFWCHSVLPWTWKSSKTTVVFIRFFTNKTLSVAFIRMFSCSATLAGETVLCFGHITNIHLNFSTESII